MLDSFVMSSNEGKSNDKNVDNLARSVKMVHEWKRCQNNVMPGGQVMMSAYRWEYKTTSLSGGYLSITSRSIDTTSMTINASAMQIQKGRAYPINPPPQDEIL